MLKQTVQKLSGAVHVDRRPARRRAIPMRHRMAVVLAIPVLAHILPFVMILCLQLSE